jgi:hypothetical protein
MRDKGGKSGITHRVSSPRFSMVVFVIIPRWWQISVVVFCGQLERRWAEVFRGAVRNLNVSSTPFNVPGPINARIPSFFIIPRFSRQWVFLRIPDNSLFDGRLRVTQTFRGFCCHFCCQPQSLGDVLTPGNLSRDLTI